MSGHVLNPIDAGLAAVPGHDVVDERALWLHYTRTRDPDARARLIDLHLGYAKVVAASYYAKRIHDEIEFGDYHQFASLALVESVDRYDPDRGASFRTFAARRMHGAILDGLESLTEKQSQIAVQQRLKQERLQSLCRGLPPGAEASGEPVAKRVRFEGEQLFTYLAEVGIGLALGKLLEGTGMLFDTADAKTQPDSHYRSVELAQLQRRVRDLVQQLGPQERTVVTLHYLQEHAFDDIARRMDLTRGRISQIHRQALLKLRELLKTTRRCDVAW